MELEITSFELQVSPKDFLFTVTPAVQAPVVVGFGPQHRADGQARATLVPDDRKLFAPILDSVASLIQSHQVLSAAPNNPDAAFEAKALGLASVHIRVVCSDDQMWSAVYSSDDLPSNVRQLVEEARTLGQQIAHDHPQITLAGDDAMKLIDWPSFSIAERNQLEALVGLKILWHTTVGGPLRWLWTSIAIAGIATLGATFLFPAPPGFFWLLGGATLIATGLALPSWSSRSRGANGA